MTQFLAVGALGIAGYGIYARSKQIQRITDPNYTPLIDQQETAARNYVMAQLVANKTAIGDDIVTALNAMNWLSLPSTIPDGVDSQTVISYPAGGSMTYYDLFYSPSGLPSSGLRIAQIANNYRTDNATTPPIVNLSATKVQNPIVPNDPTLVALKALINDN